MNKQSGTHKDGSNNAADTAGNQHIHVHDITKIYHGSGGEKKTFTVLDTVNFRIEHGERVGIVGSNGAGKSTLLNIISGFTQQTSGRIDIEGKVSAILDMGAGMQEEMSGRENLYESAKLFGLSEDIVEDKVLEIASFIDLGVYLDLPVKTYSSGMKARLAFGMMTFIQPEILIIDEVLGVGDAEFVEKSNRKLVELCNNGKILIMVSHSMHALQSFTTRCLWLDRGKLIMDGNTLEVTEAYSQFIRAREEEKRQKEQEKRLRFNNQSGAAEITQLLLRLAGTQKERTIFDLFDDVEIEMQIKATAELSSFHVCVDIELEDGTLLLQDSFGEKELSPLHAGESIKLTATLEHCRLAQRVYTLICRVYHETVQVASRTVTFEMVNNKIRYYNTSLFYPEYSMQYIEIKTEVCE